MAALPKFLQQLQKNARNKEYRLRARGADPDQVAAFSPRVSASEVARMSAIEQRAYAKRLATFNSRQERFSVSGADVVPPARSRTMEAMRREYNRQMAARERQLDATYRGSPLQAHFGYEDVREALVLQGYKLRYAGGQIGGAYIGGQVRRLQPMEEPSSRQAAQRRSEMFKEMIAPGAAERRRDRARENIRTMLVAAGRDDVVDEFMSLTDTQFDLLTTITPFMSKLAQEYEAVAGDLTGDRLRLIVEQATREDDSLSAWVRLASETGA